MPHFTSLLLLFIAVLVASQASFGQHGSTSNGAASNDATIPLDEEAFAVQSIYTNVLEDGACYQWLEHLAKRIGHRLSGSSSALEAIEYCRGILESLDIDSVWLQPCEVPRWVRGDHEIVRIVKGPGTENFELSGLALGNSVGTGPDGLFASVIEVQGIDELNALPDEEIHGRIVFFNRPMDPTLVNTFRSYGRAVDQRSRGPIAAARKGAVAAVVRSMTTLKDDVPHTGTTGISEDGFNIPAVAISTNDADLLSKELANGEVQLYIRTTCEMLEPVTSYNVIGQINGTDLPEEIILVGGHLDSWDVGEGAHDDGTGCVQSIDVLRTLKAMNYQPRRTIRCVLFMNEENGLNGATTYAEVSDLNGEFHLAAIESDMGGFTPRGFSATAKDDLLDDYLVMMNEWWSILDARDLYMKPGGGGADINPLKPQGGVLIGLNTDTQRYFDFHHAETDVFEAVNERELKLGTAAMTSLVYLIDKYGEAAQ